MELPLTLRRAHNVWSVGVDGDTMWSEWGKAGGKKSRSERHFARGRQGRDAAEQAAFEARAAARRKLSEGYHGEEDGGGEAGAAAAAAEAAAPLPMLATDWEKLSSTREGRLLGEQLLLQPKLDGVRCVAHAASGRLYSRRGHEIVGVPHISEAVRLSASVAAPPGEWLDGEIYCHDMSFQRIVAILSLIHI